MSMFQVHTALINMEQKLKAYRHEADMVRRVAETEPQSNDENTTPIIARKHKWFYAKWTSLLSRGKVAY